MAPDIFLPIKDLRYLNRARASVTSSAVCFDLLPITLNVDKTAISAMADAQEHSASFTDTLKSGMRPAATTALRSTVAELRKASGGS